MEILNKLKDKIKGFVDSRVQSIRNNQQQLQQAQFSYAQISNLFSKDHFIPFSAWAISPETIHHVLNDIQINKREFIVEFGAGASTFYIAKLIKLHNLDARFNSVESNPEWISTLRYQLKAYGLDEYVNFIQVDLEPISSNFLYKSQKCWYDLEKVSSLVQGTNKIDCILVDGPFGGITPYARYSAVPFLRQRLADNFGIFLDDIGRQEEWEIAREWRKLLNCQIQFHGKHAYLFSHSDFDIAPLKI
ncbi:hypothetical protein [Christiangramia aquimixticola]|uniref:hypothetical protein n=1 Tax=Christiangramia aquimixticola TaxID=1697558 RepID=UPI003AA7D860